MKIDFLEKLDFYEILKIEALKISIGDVIFENYGQTSQITISDLRYYWDGEKFGLHVSDSKIDIFSDFINFLKNENLIDKIEVLYIGRTLISKFNHFETSLKSLKYIYFYDNPELTEISLYKFTSLEEFICTNCQKLERLEFRGECKGLKKLDVSNCKIHTFKFYDLPNLEYLNIQRNTIGKINITNLSKLKYFFAQGNQNLEIIWPKTWIFDDFSILGLDDSNQLISKDILEIAQKYSDEELRINLKEYLQLITKYNKKLVKVNRHQLVLLGNSTAGKTELKHRILNEVRNEQGSTHGVQYFIKRDKDLEIMGFDFGGQDYYHALHLPFFDNKNHFLVIWGNHIDKTWGEYDPDYFYEKMVEGIETLMYPLKYWIESIANTLEANRLLIDINESNEVWSEVSRNKYKENLEPVFRDFESRNKGNYLPTVDILQNQRIGTEELFLNIKDLKKNTNLNLEEILTFDFTEKKVVQWLNNKINKKATLLQNEILKPVKELGFQLYESQLIFISKDALENKIRAILPKIGTVETTSFIKSLINYNYIFYFGKLSSRLSENYVVNIQIFTENIYKILSKELLTIDSGKGYFTKDEAYSRLGSIDDVNKKFILDFLLASDIVFEVNEEQNENDNPKFIAPTYLPPPNQKIESLFLESFEEPDCHFEFRDFFHPNIMLQVIKHFKNQKLLVYDGTKTEYLIWKNCVIIYNFNPAEIADSDSKKKKLESLLKLELLLPNQNHPDRLPCFTISRNNSAYVENDQFKEVFKYINSLMASYRPKITIKNPYGGDPIPFKDINQQIEQKSGGNQIHSPFIQSNGVLYPIYDFRHFLDKDNPAPLKIFIAYSKYDDQYRLELRDHLAPGISLGKFIVFDDRQMEMGEKWNARLKKELEQCDIFIVLISVKTLGTPYVMNTEIPAAFDRMNNGSLKIIPILLSQCDWTKTGLSELNVYDKANPLVSQNNNLDLSRDLSVNERATKWKEIVLEIEKYLPNDPNPSNRPAPSDEPVSGTH